MRKPIVAAVLAALLMAGAVPAFAQEEATTGSMGAYVPDYRLVGKWVYIDYDIRMECPTFAASVEDERTPAGDIPGEALSVLDECAEAGLLSPASASAGGAKEELPDSGGPPLPTLLGASGALLVAGFLLARKVAG